MSTSLFSQRCLRNPTPATVRSTAASLKSLTWTSSQQQKQQTAAFSSTPATQARNRGGPKKDPRVTQIRYFLQHPLTPRPLRFSRQRFLRHWTIHRAWQLYSAQQRRARELELERQYNSMREACEALRLMDGNGMTLKADGAGANEGKDVGRLYRIAMSKKGIWEGVPIEYARIQTENPGRDGWNHGWTR
ncbi:hypothetical protein AAFC00_001459 [Neodothiora populina]|uniref:Large ribosomal subunit protein mL40 n=1 Tax=Neodothiora populina TaxID=2781224 RepID=A0ABR3PNY4_9PEZI